MQQKTPNYIKYLFVNLFSIVVYAFIFRLIFYFFFAQLDTVSNSEIQQAFGLGIRFDIKLATLVVFPIAMLLFIINQRFFTYKIYKKISVIYFTIMYLVITLFFIFDFGLNQLAITSIILLKPSVRSFPCLSCLILK